MPETSKRIVVEILEGSALGEVYHLQRLRRKDVLVAAIVLSNHFQHVLLHIKLSVVLLQMDLRFSVDILYLLEILLVIGLL